MKITVKNKSDLIQVAQTLVDFAKNERFFIINGPMGSGKTTFTKEICKVFGVEDTVSSPTFSIVNEYLGANHSVYHFDFYRIKSLTEVYDIGYEDYFYGDGICIVEWAEKVQSLLPESYVEVNIKVLDEDAREFEFIRIG